ncbi:protein FAR1-RELATED SEQUENCE 5-like [Spinacia oleracea]|uniref:Protein FAR1-RELATED SEQUENCE 5-like n=1 Tax=Spinacia oleracea TaxID=3562 RepID=A0ABM3QQP5_SPIOL|nr:protein FAR1-RELATED SEQUENCE 5-like [Spinacia oleracea]XP_056685684.1 protein FAR1-RELATED SEQUENCE 5-like [Spinacia oleracea]
MAWVDLNESVPDLNENVPESSQYRLITDGQEVIVNPPSVGMCFTTGHEFFEFCQLYAFKEGFEMFIKSNKLKKEYKEKGVSKSGVGKYEAKPHMMELIRLKCKKGGVKKGVGSNVTGCKMNIYGVSRDGLFTILTCDLQHNHPLNPDCSRLMVNYRCIDGTTFKRAMINDMGGVSISKNFGTHLIEKGGYENITFNNRDLRNAINVERRSSRFSAADAAGLDAYFKAQRDLHPEFYSSIQVDDDGVFTNAFWSDARSRGTCKYFGDVITFDTTFACNRYRIPFAPFIGVNHHGKSIIFAAALISHENTPSFVWVFEEFLKCMGKAPLGILTDQDKAICRAIELVFPGVRHRLCLWHMLQNASKNLGSLSDWKKIDTLIRTAIHDLIDPDEFDEAWCHVMDEYGLRGPGWMKDAYDNRRQWAPAYNRGKFWAGMSSTQRSEGMNRFFKTHVNLDCGLVLFIHNYEYCMRIKAEEEKQDNFDNIDKPAKIDVDKSVLVEYVLVKTYTSEKFAEVVKERRGLTHTNVTKTSCHGSVVLYRADEKLTSPFWRKRFKSYDVRVDKENGDLHCSCNLFEFTGILCRHIMRAMDVEDFQFVPEKYILQRWMKCVRSYESIRVSYFDPLESIRLGKAKELSQRHNYLSELAMRNDDALRLYKEAMDVVRLKMEDVVGIRKTGEKGDDLICWWDPDARNVFGRRRLRPREFGERARLRDVEPVVDENRIKTPVDKRHTGRAKTKRNAPFGGKAGGNSKNKKVVTEEEVIANEELICNAFGNLPSYRARQQHANHVGGTYAENVPQSSNVHPSQSSQAHPSQLHLSQDYSQSFEFDINDWRTRL